MKNSISALVLAFVVAVSSGHAQEPSEGYITTPDKVRLFYKIEGSGSETLVMVHGGPANSLESIRPDMVPLTKGRRVIYYDQRGNGKSDLIADPEKLGYRYHVADLEALRRHFRLDKMSLLGNSWGGLLISLYAIEHADKVDRLVLDSPAPPIKQYLQDMNDAISDRMSALYSPAQLTRARSLWNGGDWRKVSDPHAVCREFFTMVLTVYTYARKLDSRFKGDVCFGSKEAIRVQQLVNDHIWDSLGDYNVLPKLAAVKAPALVIHGVADVIPQRSSELWASGYPNARLLLIEKAGHVGHVETPDIFFPAVETFLKGNFPADAKKIGRLPVP